MTSSTRTATSRDAALEAQHVVLRARHRRALHALGLGQPRDVGQHDRGPVHGVARAPGSGIADDLQGRLARVRRGGRLAIGPRPGDDRAQPRAHRQRRLADPQIGNTQSKMAALHAGSNWLYAAADLTPAYNGNSNIQKVHREMVYLQPNAIIVYDRVAVRRGHHADLAARDAEGALDQRDRPRRSRTAATR